MKHPATLSTRQRRTGIGRLVLLVGVILASGFAALTLSSHGASSLMQHISNSLANA